MLLLRWPEFKTTTLQGASVLEVCVCVCITYVCPHTIDMYYNICVSSYVSILEFRTIASVQVASVLEVADEDMHKRLRLCL
jgi:hypothetical protein